ncbi:hypothetical protein [uncultured Thermomonospora sp.]|uniref:hypothetical protein n=1 Tax=uncultured Thermomonospora sp. TaxID=671175 RepID=UPI00259BBC64|nr:hypothetical protein [uncultured Thermomonospora sp.]
MRYRGIRRRSRERPEEDFASSPPEQPPAGRGPRWLPTRPRASQPRDRWGRFRKGGRDDDLTVRHGPDGRTERGDRRPAVPGAGPAVAERPGYRLRDFELDPELPRAQPHPPDVPPRGDGLRHCGVLEGILHRQWDAAQGAPSPEVVRAIDSLAELPDALKVRLAGELEGIYVGQGGVPQLDHMGHLSGRPLPSGRATWDICAGAYGDRKIVVGDRPSPTPDVMMHEVGHALDDIDGEGGRWRSDSADFRALYARCLPYLASDFHRQPAELGRREFFADAFAAISSRQRPALVDMLGGNIRLALDVMLFFNRRYGI